MATNLKYYAQKSEDGYPIPSTMMGFAKTPPSKSNLVEIKAENSTAGGGQKVVAAANGLRYFVRRKADGTIIPNSLISGYKAPTGYYYEFKLIVTA
jgi:hypothetical protein